MSDLSEKVEAEVIKELAAREIAARDKTAELEEAAEKKAIQETKYGFIAAIVLCPLLLCWSFWPVSESNTSSSNTASSKSSSSIALVGPGYVKIGGVAAVNDKDTVYKLADLYKTDYEAYSKLVVTKIALGQAELLNKNDRVHVTESSAYHGMVKVRLEGDYKEYWTLGTAIKNR